MILSVDPGLINFAWAVFSDDGICVESKTISYNPKEKLSQEERLADVFAHIVFACEKYSVKIVVVEKQFMELMIQICGVVRAAAGEAKAKTVLYVPASWKKKATGKGNISEEDLKQFVVDRYPEFVNRSEHEIDACGMYIAYCNEKAVGNDQATKKAPKKRNVRKD